MVGRVDGRAGGRVDGWVDEGWGGWVGPERRTSLQCMSRDTHF